MTIEVNSSTPLIKTALLVLLSVTLIVIGDTAGKELTRLGFDPLFVACARFVIAVVVMLPFSGLQLKEIKYLITWPILFRSSVKAVGIICILTALKTEQMANVFGAFFIAPIIAFVLSATLLKERVTFMRLVLVILGFIGVLLVVKPGFGVTKGIGLGFLAGCIHGTFIVSTRWLANKYRPRFLLISQLIIGSFIILPLNIGLEFPILNLTAIVLLTVSAFGSAFGNLVIVFASRNAPASVVAPLIYSQLIVATIIGFFVFNDLPDKIAMIGLVIIVISGLGTLWFANKQNQLAEAN